MNTPAIIKYPFWQLTQANSQAFYITINSQPILPKEIKKQTLGIAADLDQVIRDSVNLIQH